MNFNYEAYVQLLNRLRNRRYAFCSYHDYEKYDRCAILRHDIDYSLEQAVGMAKLEEKNGVKSTYFVLLTSNFYNVASASSQAVLQQIQKLGHEIGLHFDEMAYPLNGTPEETVQRIQKEGAVLSALLDTPITTVSMHRPSQATLDAQFEIPGMVNSYGKTFFRDFKYLSDSRRRWREPVEEIIASGAYDRLHILTHAFWYHEQEESIENSVGAFIRGGNRARYQQFAENITNLPSILSEEET